MKKIYFSIVIVLLFLPPLFGQPPRSGIDRQDLLVRLGKVHWDMKKGTFNKLFPDFLTEQGGVSYGRDELNGRQAVVYVEFSRKTNTIIQAAVGVPVGDLSDEEIMKFYSEIEQQLIKQYGRPAAGLRGRGAQNMYNGIVAYDEWKRKNTDIIFLLDTDSQRLRGMIQSLGEDLPPEASFLQEKGDKVVALIFRRAGLLGKRKPGKAGERENR